MNPYEYEYLRTMASMNDKQKEDYEKAKEWLDKHYKEYTDEDFLDWYAFAEAPDEDKKQIYRNSSVHILYCQEYDYFEILLNGEKK